MRKGIVIALLFLFACIIINAQDTRKYPAVSIMSANAASLGKYLDYPVSHHTGIPEISIPIHTVTEGSLTLPINLSYHAAGLNIQEVSSNVGAGWSLNAGGMVSRTVKGLPDEKAGFEGNFSFYSHNGYSNFFIDAAGTPDYNTFLNGFKDGEPDIFFFNVLGHSGKFYFREDKTPIMIPEGDYKIETQVKPGANTYNVHDYIQGFIITTPDGTRFYLGATADPNDVDPVEKGAFKTHGNIPDYESVISSWYLYKIESADARSSISLTYRNEGYGYFTYIPQGISTSDNAVGIIKKFVYGVVIDKIITSNEHVSFVAGALRTDLSHKNSQVDDANTEATSLAEVKIESKRTSFCKSFRFTYDYFVNNSDLVAPVFQPTNFFITDKKRLKLNSLQEYSCDNSVANPATKFYYYDETSVPRRLSLGQDHWGFFNGANDNVNLLPPLYNTPDAATTASSNLTDDREAHWPQMRAGSLRSIQYPTGGGVEFNYEPNRVMTKQCQNERGTSVFGVSGGMTAASAGFDTPYSLTVKKPTLYSFMVASASIGSGEFYIDNVPIISVKPGETKDDFIMLNPGTYQLKWYANADNGFGQGVMATFYLTASNCVDIPKMVGGMRIKNISHFGVDKVNKIIKEFEYDSANLYSVPTYIFKLKHELLAVGGIRLIAGGSLNQCKMNGSVAQSFFSSSSTQPMQTTQGYHIGYGRVKEKYPDGGYIINRFHGAVVLPKGWTELRDVAVTRIDQNQCSPSDPIWPEGPPAYDFNRGNMASKTVYDKDNHKLTETKYSSIYKENPVGVFGFLSERYQFSGTVLPTSYEVRSSKMIRSEEVNRTFNPLNASEFVETKTTTDYSSAFHHLPTNVTITGNGIVTESRMNYVKDITACNYACPSCADTFVTQAAALRQTYLDNLNINCPKDKKALCGTLLGCSAPYDPCVEEWACRICSWTNYQYRLNALRKQYTACIYGCKVSNTCLSDGLLRAGNANTLYQMESQNQIAQPVEVSEWKNGNLLSSVYFDNQLVNVSPVQIQLKNIFSLRPASPSASFTSAAISTSTVYKDNRYDAKAEMTYSYDEGRIVQHTGRDGITTSYVWGFNNSVPVVKAQGVDYTTLKSAYVSDPVNFRSAPSMNKAMIITYDYDPVVGMVSTTDPNGKTQTYSYDKLGRMIIIKDHNGKVVEQYQYQYKLD